MDVGKVNVSIRKPKNVTQEGSERVRERNMLHEIENSNQALHKVDSTLQSGKKPWGVSGLVNRRAASIIETVRADEPHLR